MTVILDEFKFNKEGILYGLLYAEPWKDWDTQETKAIWSLKIYTSDKSRKRGIKRVAQPGRPVFIFELTIKQIAKLGRPLPFVPDEKRREHKPPEGFYDKTIYKSDK